jgi:hypothetical protein
LGAILCTKPPETTTNEAWPIFGYLNLVDSDSIWGAC